METEYFFIGYEFTPGEGSEPWKGNAVLSEHPVGLYARMLGKAPRDKFLITLIQKIGEADYNTAKPFNPGKGKPLDLTDRDSGSRIRI